MTFSLLLRSSALASVVVLGAQAASAETFRWASTTDPQTMDPHAVNAAPVLSFLNNIYEGLVRRNQNMQIEPSLATSWEPLEAENGWRFHLREGVTFHDGSHFDANDVVVSWAAGIDAGNPLHTGNSGAFEYYSYLFLVLERV